MCHEWILSKENEENVGYGPFNGYKKKDTSCTESKHECGSLCYKPIMLHLWYKLVVYIYIYSKPPLINHPERGQRGRGRQGLDIAKGKKKNAEDVFIISSVLRINLWWTEATLQWGVTVYINIWKVFGKIHLNVYIPLVQDLYIFLLSTKHVYWVGSLNVCIQKCLFSIVSKDAAYKCHISFSLTGARLTVNSTAVWVHRSPVPWWPLAFIGLFECNLGPTWQICTTNM